MPKTLALLALVFLLVSGCQGGARPQRLIDNIEDVQVTEFQMRLLTSD